MAWALSRTFFLCAWRRAARAGASNPTATAAVLLTVAALPALSLWSGVRAAEPLRAAIQGHPGAADDAAIVLAIAAAMAGVLLATAAPRRELLGGQLLPAPVSRAKATTALTLLPIAATLGAAAVPAALFLAPIAGPAAPAGLAALGWSAAAAALVSEAVVACARRALRGLAFAGLAAALVLADPVGELAGALSRETSWAVFPTAVAALAGWGICTGCRPAKRGSRGAVHFCARGVVTAAFARYGRNGRVRTHAVASVLFAGVGAGTLRAAGFDASACATLAGFTAIVGAAMVPLAAPGLDNRAAWLWRSAPVSATSLFLRASFAALAAATLVAALGVAVAWAIAPTGPQIVGSAAAAAAVVFGCALLTGTLARSGEQLFALAVFAAVTAIWSFGLGHLASAIGAERGLAAALVAAASLAATVAAAAVLDARGAR